MSENTKAEEYLIKAAMAEAISSTAGSAYLKQCWLDIAEGYRDLAKKQEAAATGMIPPSESL